MKKYINYIKFFFNMLYSYGEVHSKYFLQDIKIITKEELNETEIKNQNIIWYIVFIAFINAVFIIQELSYKILIVTAILTFLIGFTNPIFKKYFKKY